MCGNNSDPAGFEESGPRRWSPCCLDVSEKSDDAVRCKKIKLQSRSDSLSGNGNFFLACDCECEFGVCQDSQVICEIDRMNRRLEYVYEISGKNRELAKQSRKLRRQRLCEYAVLGIGIIFIVFAVQQYSNKRVLCTQNCLLIRIIKENEVVGEEIKEALVQLQQMMPSLGVEVSRKKNKKEELFLRLQQLMFEKKLYLNPDFSRTEATSLLYTNRQYLTESVQLMAQMGFGNYVNKFRLEHAQKLLSGKMDMSTECVAWESGFNSARTFYRLFKKEYTMTPSEFRTACRINAKRIKEC